MRSLYPSYFPRGSTEARCRVVAVKRCVDIERFVAHPAGYYAAGRTWLVWSWKADLAGTLVWGRLTDADAEGLIDAWRMTKALAPPYDFINDFSRIAAIDIVPFERILPYAQKQRQTFVDTTRTSVLVRPSGFASALIAGAFHLFSSSTRWRIVETTEEGFAALDRPEADAARLAVEAIFAAEASTDAEISTLRSLLSRSPTLTLSQAATQLKLSERSLQRKLEDAGTTFRKLSSESKLHEAKRLLEATEEKLSEIARRVGLSSAEQLNKLFRNQVGESPSMIRKRARDSQS